MFHNDVSHSCSCVIIPLSVVPNIYRVWKVCSTSPMIDIGLVNLITHQHACPLSTSIVHIFCAIYKLSVQYSKSHTQVPEGLKDKAKEERRHPWSP